MNLRSSASYFRTVNDNEKVLVSGPILRLLTLCIRCLTCTSIQDMNRSIQQNSNRGPFGFVATTLTIIRPPEQTVMSDLQCSINTY